MSFGTIIAAGPNGANPHAQPGEYVVKEGDLIVMDYGALYHDYHADMTRTVCVGEPSDKQREVYDIVRRAHEECAAMVRPDIIGKDVHDHSVKVISDAGYGAYYGHGLGHGVGIEIHELPGFGRGWDKPVPAGSVVTVEPGIYLPGEFGIRLATYRSRPPATTCASSPFNPSAKGGASRGLPPGRTTQGSGLLR